jgi:hypothetical protein
MMATVFEMFHINNDQHRKIPEIKRGTICWNCRRRGGHESYLAPCISVKVIAKELLVHWERLARKEKFDISLSFPSCPVQNCSLKFCMTLCVSAQRDRSGRVLEYC